MPEDSGNTRGDAHIRSLLLGLDSLARRKRIAYYQNHFLALSVLNSLIIAFCLE